MNQEPFDPSGHLQTPVEPESLAGPVAQPVVAARPRRLGRRFHLLVIAAVVLIVLAIVAERIKALVAAG